MTKLSRGNCYLCGGEIGKTAIKNHLLKHHVYCGDDAQRCCLIKAESMYDKNYWLYFDIPADRTLSTIDSFLRKIWLECCGHMSRFYCGTDTIGKGRKLSAFEIGDRIAHEYDYGTPTDTLITFVGETARAPQKNVVRLLARNVPPVFECCECGKEATEVCPQCPPDCDPYFCPECAEKHEHDYLLPVMNSPRMGDCGYCGELDVYAFDPERLAKK